MQIKFFLINWLSIIQVGKVLIFFFRKGNQCITCIKFLRSSYVFFYLIN